MAGWTLETAQEHLNTWLEASKAVATGQSYRIGTRSLERANLKEIQEMILFWIKEVEKLQSGQKGRRVMRVVPRDL